MKLLHFSIPGFLSLCLGTALADTHYVNNDTAFPAEYRTFDDALAAASDGDTIMLAPSLTTYGTLSIVGKSVKIVGGGTSNKHPALQPKRADVMDSIVDRIYVGHDGPDIPTDQPAPDFSAVDGTLISSIRTLQGVWIWSDDCVFTRCETASTLAIYGDRAIVTGSVVRGGLHINSLLNPVLRSTGSLISNCLITSGGGRAINDTTASFTHCVIGFNESPMTPSGAGTYSSLASTTFRHCILAGSTNSFNSYRSDGTRLHHCLVVGTASSAVIPGHSSGNGNITTTEPTGVFDEGYTLKDGSPAIGAGEDGEDLGIFGGSTPFQWGGVPALPLIEKMDILSANPTTGLRVRVKAVARE